jgi:hypothetical protein
MERIDGAKSSGPSIAKLEIDVRDEKKVQNGEQKEFGSGTTKKLLTGRSAFLIPPQLTNVILSFTMTTALASKTAPSRGDCRPRLGSRTL